jgi:hypothetical protein
LDGDNNIVLAYAIAKFGSESKAKELMCVYALIEIIQHNDINLFLMER